MQILGLITALILLTISTLYSDQLYEYYESRQLHKGINHYTKTYLNATFFDELLKNNTSILTSCSTPESIEATYPDISIMPLLPKATIVPRLSAARGHANHGWLDSYHTFSFASYHDPLYTSFGSLRVLNEDRVAAHRGFDTHPHRDAEIFSYILSGQLTHRDSMKQRGKEGTMGDDFYRMERGDVQFTTGGTGIAHSEQNESDKEVHFLQIWALPWKRGLTPRYHTKTFPEEAKKEKFVPILSPLKAGLNASAEEEKEARPSVEETIPIHADFVMAAGIIGAGKRFNYTVGGGAYGSDVVRKADRRVYIHLPMTKKGAAQIRLDGRDSAVLREGDGAFITDVKVGDVLSVESVGQAEAEVIVLDSD